MSKRLIVAALATALPLTLALTAPAMAQQACGARDEIVSVLEGKYGEAHRASGLQTATSMVEVWASDSTGTWTILVTQPDGKTCVAASGENWLEYEAKALVSEQPS